MRGTAVRRSHQIVSQAERLTGDFTGQFGVRQPLDPSGEMTGRECSQETQDVQRILVNEAVRGLYALRDLVDLGNEKGGRTRDRDPKRTRVTRIECPELSHLVVDESSLDAPRTASDLPSVPRESGGPPSWAGQRFGDQHVELDTFGVPPAPGIIAELEVPDLEKLGQGRRARRART